jgi:hypothetical protein
MAVYSSTINRCLVLASLVIFISVFVLGCCPGQGSLAVFKSAGIYCGGHRRDRQSLAMSAHTVIPARTVFWVLWVSVHGTRCVGYWCLVLRVCKVATVIGTVHVITCHVIHLGILDGAVRVRCRDGPASLH